MFSASVADIDWRLIAWRLFAWKLLAWFVAVVRLDVTPKAPKVPYRLQVSRVIGVRVMARPKTQNGRAPKGHGLYTLAH